MTLAEQLRQEGRQEGRQNGIITNLQIRLGPVPEGLIEAIRTVNDPARLDALQSSSLTCDTFESFSGTL